MSELGELIKQYNELSVLHRAMADENAELRQRAEAAESARDKKEQEIYGYMNALQKARQQACDLQMEADLWRLHMAESKGGSRGLLVKVWDELRAERKKRKASESALADAKDEIEHGGYWQKRATDALQNGVCPYCFGSEEHKHTCYVQELEIKLALSGEPMMPSVNTITVASQEAALAEARKAPEEVPVYNVRWQENFFKIGYAPVGAWIIKPDLSGDNLDVVPLAAYQAERAARLEAERKHERKCAKYEDQLDALNAERVDYLYRYATETRRRKAVQRAARLLYESATIACSHTCDCFDALKEDYDAARERIEELEKQLEQAQADGAAMIELVIELAKMVPNKRKVYELVEAYEPHGIHICCWCREGNSDKPEEWIKTKREMSDSRDTELGGDLCKECEASAKEEDRARKALEGKKL